MISRLLSLVDPPPVGFTFQPQLASRDVRRGVFALYAPAVEVAEAALAPWSGRVTGLLITPGPAVRLTYRASNLYHLEIPPADLAHLARWAAPLLQALEAESRQAERCRSLALEAARLSNDRAQAAEEFGNFRLSLLGEIQERRRAENALRASEQRFRMIYNSVNDAIIIHDPATGAILDVNDRACDLFGYQAEELKNMDIAGISAPDPRFSQAEAMARLRNTGQGPRIFTWQARHKSGHIFWIEINTRATTLNGVSCVLMTARDITERVEAEETRRHLEAQLLQTQKLESLGVLAGGIAHDFNNLLLVILGNLDMANLEAPADSPGREYLTEAERAGRRAAELCRQMLAYAGKSPISFQPINLGRLVKEMGHLMEVSVTKKAALHYDLPGLLPAVSGDATQLQQVIMNLIVNASEAMGDRTGHITLRAGVQFFDHAYLAATFLGPTLPEGPYVFLEVEDDGSGMSPEIQRKVFDPFFSTKFTGRGLGLATVFGIVRSHHGAIKLDSAPDRGTCFRILLPAIEEAAKETEESSAPEQDWRGHGTVLVVDDDEAVRALSRRALRQMGFNVVSAADGREALAVYRASLRAGSTGEIRGVLLDLTMPYMDGEQACRQLRELNAGLPIVMTSGYSESEVAPRFQGQSVRFLQKPYRAAELRKLMREVFDKP